jgi:hypothetical protein
MRYPIRYVNLPKLYVHHVVVYVLGKMLGSVGVLLQFWERCPALPCPPQVLLDLKALADLFLKTFLIIKIISHDILGHDESSTHVGTFTFLSEAS